MISSDRRLKPAAPAPRDWRNLAAVYGLKVRQTLGDSIVPFWSRTLDAQHGGVFNCWNNAGTLLVRRDKFTWSQGRFAWLWSRLAEAATIGLLPGRREVFLDQAAKTVRFLQRHAFLPDGRCAFRLSEAGEPLEVGPGLGLSPSIYADCFVAMGLAEYARVSADRAVLDGAWSLFRSIELRISNGDFATHPDLIPDGYHSYAIEMIRLNVCLVVQRALEQLGDERAGGAWTRCVEMAGSIIERFLSSDGRWAEMRPRDAAVTETLLARHLNPGHALECAWMLLEVAARAERPDWIEQIARGVEFACNAGWDVKQGGGLLHFVDHTGGEPRGEEGDSIYEKVVRGSWSTKLWWVHSEAMFATLLAYRLTGSAIFREWFERISEYTLRVFPHPDPTVGEWIQIRDRTGQPLEQVVALPVKDPYHIARNLLQILELFSESETLPLP